MKLKLRAAFPLLPVLLAGIPAEFVASVHDYDSLQFFYLIFLKDNREWFVQCTLVKGADDDARASRDVLDGFQLN